ncbi:MAG: hypothetical protein M3P91_02050 [Actinomycetota bacterium]|nr:hypothetical protein [Actinomycetota bacterium]
MVGRGVVTRGVVGRGVVARGVVGRGLAGRGVGWAEAVRGVELADGRARDWLPLPLPLELAWPGERLATGPEPAPEVDSDVSPSAPGLGVPLGPMNGNVGSDCDAAGDSDASGAALRRSFSPPSPPPQPAANSATAATAASGLLRSMKPGPPESGHRRTVPPGTPYDGVSVIAEPRWY